MPYVMSNRGDIVAILWADHNPLHAPPLPNVSNKILWVSRINRLAITITSPCATPPASYHSWSISPG